MKLQLFVGMRQDAELPCDAVWMARCRDAVRGSDAVRSGQKREWLESDELHQVESGDPTSRQFVEAKRIGELVSCITGVVTHVLDVCIGCGSGSWALVVCIYTLH